MRDAVLVHVELRGGNHIADEGLEFSGWQQVQLEVLRPAPDGLDHLVWLGCGQDEDHMVRGFLQRLEKGVLGTCGQHVDLVQEVHLGPAGGTESDPRQQLAHVVDLVVGRRIQFVQVKRRAGFHGHARLAFTAGFAVQDNCAVQGLGQHPCGRRLSGSAGTAEQVGVEDAVLQYGVSKGGNHVLLSPDLRESPGSEAPVERRVFHEPTLQRHHRWSLGPGTAERRREWDSNPR